MPWINVDVEADGDFPGVGYGYSMVCFGAVVLDEIGKPTRSFYGETAPISKKYKPEALAISGFTREQHEAFATPVSTMEKFEAWLNEIKGNDGKLVFVSDNPAWDFQWIQAYFHMYLTYNPFGFSGRRIGDFYSGLAGDYRKASEWKKLRVTKHTHNPVDDSKGNVEALQRVFERFKLPIPK